MKLSSLKSIFIIPLFLVPLNAHAFLKLELTCHDENESFSLTSILDSDGSIAKLLHQDFQPDHLNTPSIVNEFELEILNLEITDEHLILTAETSDKEVVFYKIQTTYDYIKKETGSLFYSGTLSYLTEDYEGHLNVTCEATTIE